MFNTIFFILITSISLTTGEMSQMKHPTRSKSDCTKMLSMTFNKETGIRNQYVHRALGSDILFMGTCITEQKVKGK